MFSFNSAMGACETCRGFGRVIGVDWGLVIPNGNAHAKAVIESWAEGEWFKNRPTLADKISLRVFKVTFFPPTTNT
jgi:excinuclease UvrABC ATPase subunit